jgi:MFS family permease
VSLTYIGSGIGRIAMGWLAGRIGLRRVVMSCGTMIAAGLVLASFGGLYQLYASNLLLIGLLGASGMFSPMMAYVTRWFDRHRGSAIALVSSGQYVAGAAWPLLFQLGVDAFGWRLTMRGFAIVGLSDRPDGASLLAAIKPGDVLADLKKRSRGAVLDGGASPRRAPCARPRRHVGLYLLARRKHGRMNE